MCKGTFRHLMSICTAALLAMTLAACGNDTPAPVEKTAPETVEPAKATEDAKEVAYKCAKCNKVASLAVSAKPPS